MNPSFLFPFSSYRFSGAFQLSVIIEKSPFLRKTIDYNRDNGTSHPAVAVKVGDKKDYCHALKIKGPCQIVYQPHQPNNSQAGGARLWIEVEPENIVERVYFSDGDYGPPPEVVQQRAKNQKNKSKTRKKKSKIKGKRK